MKYLVTALLFVNAAVAGACSCSYTPYFCAYADEYFSYTNAIGRSGDSVAIVHAEYLGFENLGEGNGYIPFYNYRVISSVAGMTVPDTLHLYGQDGVNCNGEESAAAGQEVLLLFPVYPAYDPFFPGDSARLDFPSMSVHPLPGCGPASLRVENGVVSGPIAPGISTITLDDVAGQLAYCFDGLSVSTDNPEEGEELIDCFPNPASDQLTITAKKAAGIENITLYDMHGRRILRRLFNDGLLSRRKVDVSNLPDGVYLLVAETAAGRTNKRVVIHQAN